MLTVAVATSHGVNVYTLDCYDVRGVHSFTLLFHRDLYVTNLAVLRLPMSEKRGSSVFSGCVNYAITQPVSPTNVGTQIFITTDDGSVMSWNTNHLRKQCEKNYRMTHKNVARNSKPAKSNVPGSPVSKDQAAQLAQAALMAKAIDLKNSLSLNEAALMLVGRNNKMSKTRPASFESSSSPGSVSDATSVFSTSEKSGAGSEVGERKRRVRGDRDSKDKGSVRISKQKQEALDGIANKIKYLSSFDRRLGGEGGVDDEPGSPESPSITQPKKTARDVKNSNFQFLTPRSQQESPESLPVVIDEAIPPSKIPFHETKQQQEKRILLDERRRQKAELEKRKNPHNLPAKDLRWDNSFCDTPSQPLFF